MPGQSKEPKGPTTEQTLGGLSAIAGLAAPFIGGGWGDAIAGVKESTGTGKDMAAEQVNPFGVAGGMSNMLSWGTGLMDDMGSLSNVYGGMGNAFGMITGTQDAFDDKKSTSERIVGGADAVGNGLGLWGTMGGFSLGATGVGGAATMGGSSIGALATAGGATAAGAAGAVVGAGVAGWKVGSLMNDIGNSDWARDDFWGKDEFTGENRTATDALIDTMVDFNLGADEMGRDANAAMDRAGESANTWLDDATGTDWIGDAVGGALDYGGGAAEAVMDYGGGFLGGVGTAVGSIGTTTMGIGTAAANYVGSWFD